VYDLLLAGALVSGEIGQVAAVLPTAFGVLVSLSIVVSRFLVTYIERGFGGNEAFIVSVSLGR